MEPIRQLLGLLEMDGFEALVIIVISLCLFMMIEIAIIFVHWIYEKIEEIYEAIIQKKRT